MNAYSLFEHSLLRYPDRIALASGIGNRRRALSYGELNKQVDRVTGQLLQHGLCPGDRVLLAVPVSIETYVVMLAIMKAGMIAMYIDPAHSATRIARILHKWPPAAIVSTKRILLFRFLLPEIRRIPQRFIVNGRSRGALSLSFAAIRAGTPATARSSADSALLSFTSGSTAEPKPVLRTHGFLRRQLEALDEIAGVEPDDIDYVAMPMFVLFNLAKAITSVIPAVDMKRPGKADPVVVVEQMLAEKVNRALASPALFERLAGHCLARNILLPGLRCISTGGGPVGPALVRQIKSIAPNAQVKMVYGSTEAEPIACLHDIDVSIGDRRLMQQGAGLLVGRPVKGCDIRIIRSQPGVPLDPCSPARFRQLALAGRAIGEIVVTGKHVLTGYADERANRSTKIRVGESTWHRTGDAGYFDAIGRLWLVGRSSAAINDHRGRVYPFQVEYALAALAGIRRAALLGHAGQRVLVVEASKRDFDSDGAAAARCIDRHRIDRIVFVQRIPLDRRHNAKIDYPALQRILDGGLSFLRFRLEEAAAAAFSFCRSLALRGIETLKRQRSSAGLRPSGISDCHMATGGTKVTDGK